MFEFGILGSYLNTIQNYVCSNLVPTKFLCHIDIQGLSNMSDMRHFGRTMAHNGRSNTN